VTTYREDEDGYQEDDPHHEEGSKPEIHGTGRDFTEDRRKRPGNRDTISKESLTGTKGCGSGQKGGGASRKKSDSSSQSRCEESRKATGRGQKGDETGCHAGRALGHPRGALANDFRRGLFHG